jgi:hypothetical protein
MIDLPSIFFIPKPPNKLEERKKQINKMIKKKTKGKDKVCAKWKGHNLYCLPEVEMIFLSDAQFVSAAEYGAPMQISVNEMGNYIGIKIYHVNHIDCPIAEAKHNAVADCDKCKNKIACLL